VELKGVGALAVLGRDHCSADNLDGLVAGSVATSHIVIHVFDSRVQVSVSVLTIHIVGSTSRVVLEPNTKVLNVAIVLLGNLLQNGENSKGYNLSPS
jgi:hypothetical protein